MTDDAGGENGGALMSDPVDVIIDKLLRYVRCNLFVPHL